MILRRPLVGRNTALGQPFAPDASMGLVRVIPPVALIVFAVALTRLVGSFGNSVIISAGIGMLVVAGLHVLVHWTGQVSIAQVAFVGIGAFVTARANVDLSLPLPLAAVVGVIAAIAASLVVGLPALRIRGFALAITTLAFGFAAERWLFHQDWLVSEAAGVALADTSFLGADIADPQELVIVVILIVAAVVWFTNRLGTSAVGKALRLVAHDESVAAAYGINVGAHKVFAFMVAAAMAGLAGVLTVLFIGRVSPAVFPHTASILYLSAVLLGGRGPVWGSLAAAGALGAIPILLGDLGRIVGLLGPLAILFVVVVTPGGLNSSFTTLGRLSSQVLLKHWPRHLTRAEEA